MSFTAPVNSRSGPVLPLAAMVDILFLLLIFFMTAAAFRDQDRVIEVTLPGTQTNDEGPATTPIVVTVDAEGRTYLGDRAYGLDELRARLARRAQDYPEEWVDIRGDTACEHGKIINVLDTVRAAGLYNVRMHTKPVRRVAHDQAP